MTDCAERVLYITCGKSLFYVGQIGGTARDPRNVKSPLELELGRIRRHDGHSISCEVRCDANRWDVLIRADGEALFSRRCTSEDEARYVATGLEQDESSADSIKQESRVAGRRVDDSHRAVNEPSARAVPVNASVRRLCIRSPRPVG
jgi:hypothetical protein